MGENADKMQITGNLDKDDVIYAVMTIISLVLVFIIGQSGTYPFSPYFGSIYPPIAILTIYGTGYILVKLLSSHLGFKIYGDKAVHGLKFSLLVAPIFFLVTMIIDVVFTYPSDINIELSYGMLFYPVIGFVVEIIFHVLPLSVLGFILIRTNQSSDTGKGLFYGFALISLFEPLFQIVLGTPPHFPVWITIVFGVQLFFFNMLQLWLYKKYDFVSMYIFRMVYYLLWHIVWGHLRLMLLF